MSEPKIMEQRGYRQVTVDGHLHSIDDAPAMIYRDGTRWWYREGKLHREGGPAVVWGLGTEEWWCDGQRHREDGPAVIYPDGSHIVPELRGVKQWWKDGRLEREELPPRVAAYRADLEKLRKKHFGGAR